MDMQTSKNRWLIFCVTLLSGASLVGILGAFATVKKSIKDSYDITEDIFGIVDSEFFIGNVLGNSIMILIPSKHQRRNFFISTCLHFFALSMISSVYFFPQYGKPILLIAGFIAGIQRAFSVVLMDIINQYFNSSGQDKMKVDLWYGSWSLGDLFSVLFVSFLLKMELNWALSFEIYAAIYFLASLSSYIITDELKFAQKIQEQNQQTGFSVIKDFYSKASNIFFSIQSLIMITLYYSLIMWVPLYFNSLNFQFMTAIISICYPLMYTIGIPLYNLLLNFFTHKILFKGIILFIAMLASLYMQFVGTDYSDAYQYAIIFSLCGILSGGMTCELVFSELVERVNDDKKKFHFMNVFSTVSKRLVTGLFMILIGFLTKINPNSFIHVFLGLEVIIFLSFLLKVYFDGRAERNMELNEEREEQNEDMEMRIE